MKKILLATIITTSWLFTGCGSKSGFSSADNASIVPDGGGTDNNNGNNNGPGTEQPDWNKVDLDGYPTSLDFEGQLVIKVDKDNQALILILPIPAFAFMPFTSKLNIPEIPGAFITSYTNSKGDKQLAVSLPLQTVLKGAKFLPNQKLPNGDNLPFVPAGELPGFAIQFPQNPDYRVHLYVGVNVAAAFVELPGIDLPISALSRVKNGAKTKDVGAIGYIAPKGNFDGGLYLAAQIPDKMAAVIDDLIRW